jgi:hypothetical protein
MKTSQQILSMCLSNLFEVDTQFSRLQEVVQLSGSSYWYQLYRIATCSLTEQSSELEVLSVRTIQTLVSLETLSDSEGLSETEYEEVKTSLTNLLNLRVNALSHA